MFDEDLNRQILGSQLSHLTHNGQPYSNLPHYRTVEYEHVTVKQRPYHRPKKTTSDISYLGYPNPA